MAGAAELVLREPFDKSQAAQAHSQLAAHRCAPAVAWLPTGIAARAVHAGSKYVVQFGSGSRHASGTIIITSCNAKHIDPGLPTPLVIGNHLLKEPPAGFRHAAVALGVVRQ